MKNKTPLVLLELLVMVLVFALAAALCLQVFVRSDQIARETQARTQAVQAAQLGAEVLQWAGGTMDHALETAADQLGGRVTDGVWTLPYGPDWQPGEEGPYRLEAQGESAPVEGLWQARVRVLEGETELFQLTIAWQREGEYG